MKKGKLNLILSITQKSKLAVLRYLLLVFLLVISSIGFTQNQNIKFEHLDVNSGLSQNLITCILQDSRGFMWFGTSDGLNKYDGYKFTIYENNTKDDKSISNNYISGIIEDSKGIIWISTQGGGLNRYDREKDQFIHFKNDPKNLNSISSDLLTNLAKDSGGNLWLCTGDNGLDYFEPGKNRFVHYTYNENDDKSLGGNNIRYVLEDSGHKLWVGTFGGGLNLFNNKTKNFTRFRHNEKDNTSLSSDNVGVIFEDSKHRLWIGTSGGGLDLFDRKTGKFQYFGHDVNNANSLPANVVLTIGENSAGDLWIGTENGGLAIYNSTTGIFQSHQHDDVDNQSISNNSIYSVYKDANDNMWLGTFAGGVDIFNKKANRFAHYKHTSDNSSLSNNSVLCMSESKNGKIWIGTDGGGLNLFDPATKIFMHYLHSETNKKSICGNYVLSVLEDSKGNVWVGTWGNGITVFNKAKHTFKDFKNDQTNTSSLSNDNAWKIFEDKDKNIWICTYGGGLNLFNPDNNSFTSYQHNENNPSSISTNMVSSIYQGSEGEMWVSTDDGGLNLFDKKAKTFSHFLHDNKKNSVANNCISSLCEDRNKNLWIGTITGLSFLNRRTNMFTTYTTVSGLPNNVISGILEDEKGDIWISTNKGISRYDPVNKIFKNFDVSDGLQSNVFKMYAFCKSAAGAIYFGGNNGFNQFFPGKIEEDSFEPPLVLTDFQIFNQKVLIAEDNNDPSPIKKAISETKEIILPYKNSVFSFEFASLNYTARGKKQYAYMLEGFDKTWNEIGSNRTATYTNLDPAKYLFKVKGLNSNGEWSPRILSLQLTITPPFWLTWWFKTFLVIFLLSTFAIFYRIRVNTIQKWGRQLELQVVERTHQLAHSIKEEQKARQEAENARYETDNANRDLEIKNREMEQFAYIASHDLQEPLRTTSSFIELLQKQYHRGKLDEKSDKYFTFILEASGRMKMLIKNLLDYSQIGSKKELEQVDCNKMLHMVLADLGIAISEAGADIKSDSLPVITGYATELKQLFQNLITNAIKFRKKDTPPEINISVQKKECYWQFAFKDNGIGIEEENKEKIFAIFQRLHTRSEYEGSGIGLSHCKKIVELHRGKIWVESTPDLGSTFHFTIRDKTPSSIYGKVPDDILV